MNGIDGVDITEREGKAANDQKYMFYCMQVYEFGEGVEIGSRDVRETFYYLYFTFLFFKSFKSQIKKY